ncbi:MAG: group II intron reverse transcriptase/maturase [Lachnospiraceae bacterium]|jgi:group II intron reverse transcriptase/maturase|nr:group II intron reverse transcriptase/maturase [Lachnospiraceae bacterium]MCH4029651.1 group II intron reverse transcriptase/maturase [Lachnospiraceae bacterium]MCH4067498.1 group II intron reverse transcriptase/maturase [Lachnospiraceae bacterium]MCH4113521.1 group II intron reverse transcriptase/maturase [Lachnospiraceae bacterium]
MDTENAGNGGCSQKDSAEHKRYVRAHRSFNRIWKERDSAEPDILGRILAKDNLNRAYKRVKANKGAPGVDGMTIEEALPWLKEHGNELIDRIRNGNYTPQPVRRVEIPKPDGGIRKLGIPTVIDRIIQQAIAQQLMPIYEPLFSDGSFGYRPGRSAKDAIQRIKGYAEQGYTRAVVLDLSKYFDTINHVKLLNLLRQNVKDERVIQMIKRYLKSGVMENGVVSPTEEGSPQGGNLSPLLANVYLNEFDQEFKRRGVPCIRYADDITLLAKSERASQRLLESSVKYLEGTLQLKVNREKSRTVSVFAIRNFKFLGFCFGKGRNGVFIRVHQKSWKKFKDKLKTLTSRSRCGSIVNAMKRITVVARGWLGYYGLADMKKNIGTFNGWLYRRIRMCIWKQWKLPRTRKRKLLGLGLPEWAACEGAYSRKAYWRMANSGVVKRALTKERLIHWGFFDLATAYQSVHVNC